MKYQVIRFQGLKNNETKKITGGYLFIEFLENATIKRINSENSLKMKKGETIGKSVNGGNRKEAIEYFEKTFEVV
jgi:hypothetical protein